MDEKIKEIYEKIKRDIEEIPKLYRSEALIPLLLLGVIADQAASLGILPYVLAPTIGLGTYLFHKEVQKKYEREASEKKLKQIL